ncbi:MAG: RNHCP domain-containing protein, partial [Rickettsiales bacterium]|nr:RNHCP domain-containing protein [Rickettsiales bacterium]
MEAKKFIKKVENFVCEQCGFEVLGSGYTNHCPNCLYSKHVDINPGDRLCECEGLMLPIDIEQKGGKFIIVHKCQK